MLAIGKYLSGRQQRLTVLIIGRSGDDGLTCGKLQKVFDVLYADNISDGLASACEFRPALVIMDHTIDAGPLKVMLRKKSRTSRIPVLAILRKSDISKNLCSFGWDDFIQTPLEEHELLLRVQTILHARRFLHSRYVDFEPDTLVENSYEAFLLKVKRAVEENFNNPLFGVCDLASETGTSQAQLYRKLISITGFSPNGYIRHVRLKHAAYLLSAGAGNVGEIAARVGFSSQSYFTKCFKAVHRYTPKKCIHISIPQTVPEGERVFPGPAGFAD